MNSRKPDSNEIAARVVAQATHGEFVQQRPRTALPLPLVGSAGGSEGRRGPPS